MVNNDENGLESSFIELSSFVSSHMAGNSPSPFLEVQASHLR